MKLGSLFDGSGGFPLAGSLCGIEPVWASEVEPYPIAVTRSRFPKMKHLGSVTDINGAEIEPVDIITFGSPCQDLSVAGKRAGLKHEDNGDEETTRSGLFMEAVRIIKEMREATNGRYPTFALWENVPGAFSSNKGEDFRIVLEELIKIVEPRAVMPPVPKNGWAYADSYRGDGWSLSYRVFDAQYWGVPQRRRRIYLVLDLRGERARKVLFEREGVRGYFAEGRTPWQGTSRNAENCVGADDREERITDAQYLFENHSQDTRYKGPLDVCPMLPAQLGTGGNNTPFVVEESPVYFLEGNSARPSHLGNGYSDSDKMYTLNTVDRHSVAYGVTPASFYPQMKAESQCFRVDDVANTIVNGTNPGFQNGVVQAISVESEVVAIDRAAFNQGQNALYEPQFYTDGTTSTLVAKGPSAVAYVDTTHADDVVRLDDTVAPLQARDYKGGKLVQIHYIVRRLTPTECARLQGFADRWGDIEEKTDFTDAEYRFWLDVRNTHAAINGKAAKDYTKAQMLTWYNKLHTDSAEYKMWGNGIALPTALYCMQGIEDAAQGALA